MGRYFKRHMLARSGSTGIQPFVWQGISASPWVHTTTLVSQEWCKRGSLDCIYWLHETKVWILRWWQNLCSCIWRNEGRRIVWIWPDRWLRPKASELCPSSNGTWVAKILKQPVFYDFDCQMTKDILFSVILALQNAGYPVIAIVCDMSPTNRKLWKSLNVTVGKIDTRTFIILIICVCSYV